MRPDAIAAFARSRALDVIAAVAGHDSIHDLNRISCPVLVAWGEKDRMLPRRRYATAFEDLPDIETTVLPDVGHVPMWDDPQLVADTIRAFVTRHTEAMPTSRL